MILKRSLFLVLLLATAFPLFATHQRAAEITYRWIQGLTYEVTITMYTYTPSPADDIRTTLPIIWGDNTESEIPRVTFQALPENYTLNVYRMNHTFPGNGSYTISVEDPNRNFGVVNIPNSVNVPIYVESKLIINPFLGTNNSVQLLNAPVDQGCVGKMYVHNPSAFDPDGDSLSFQLVNCRGSQGLEVPGYTTPLASTSFAIDAVTGDLTWNTPVLQGEYNVAFEITEWRNGTKIGSVVRDMQILIGACNNNPPVIELSDYHCIVAGNTLSFDVSASDPDNNTVTLTATGAPFEVQNQASIVPDPATGTPTATTTFFWNTQCENINKNLYITLFKAKDNHPEVSLTTFKSTAIQVIAPAIEDLKTVSSGNGINLSWQDTLCENISGYYIYRRSGSSGFVPDECQTGVPASAGYVRIATLNDPSLRSFRDDDNGQGLTPGINFCYMITSFFADGSESKASNESCASLKRDLPVITHVSNDSLDLSSGNVLLAWAPPTELDMNQYPGPYRYEVKRMETPNPVLVFTGIGLNDTLCTDQTINLNTINKTVVYNVTLISESVGLIGSSKPASSVFLTLTPTDKALQLNWNKDVPWRIDSTEIYRKTGSAFVKKGSSTGTAFLDTGLNNGESYTYYAKTFGSYSTSGFVTPIINFSQIASAVPQDVVAPCPPKIAVETNCSAVTNLITISTTNDSCDSDIRDYQIYFSPNKTNFSQMATVSANNAVFLHQGLEVVTGCYYAIATDTNNNVSQASEISCVDWDSCPLYELPNVFTPNGDQYNDTFIPLNYPSTNPKANIERIELVIFTRWGNTVFQTNDPLINWDGKNQTTGIDCADGTYFYKCKVFFQSLDGEIEHQLQGSITIIR